ncbi:hypothetical protein Pam4_68 [Pseudanabaena phage Pam4]|nr:hypothetical protein Pam4_68 [Pseudanabaena phage Pam4]
MADPIDTHTGARLHVYPAPEHLTPGVLLVLSMQDPSDPRTAEVILDPGAATRLRDALTDHLEAPNG